MSSELKKNLLIVVLHCALVSKRADKADSLKSTSPNNFGKKSVKCVPPSSPPYPSIAISFFSLVAREFSKFLMDANQSIFLHARH